MGRKEFLWSQSKRGTANFGAFLVSHGASEQEKSVHHFSRDLILATTSILLHQYAHASRPLQEVPAVPAGQSSQQTVAIKDSDKASQMARISPASASSDCF